MTTTLVIYWIGRTDITPNVPCLYAPNVALTTLIQTGFANTIINSEYLKETDFVLATTADGNYIFFVSIDPNGVRSFINFVTPGNVAYEGGSNATIGNLPAFADLSGNILDSNIPANTVLRAAFATPDTNLNMIQDLSTNISFTQLGAGPVTLFTPTGSKTYRLLTSILSGGTSFSGGGGDRLLSVTSGSTNLASLAAASAQALTGAAFQSGSTAFPLLSAYATPVTAANPLRIAYTGGTTNYTAGIVNFDAILIRTA